ncbi:MAG: tetratricopeptide repeat protein [Crocinitomicaceae bacterium]|nr:tetratricopeptide repeat protein [Crocinitomicaceae bacterium]
MEKKPTRSETAASIAQIDEMSDRAWLLNRTNPLESGRLAQKALVLSKEIGDQFRKARGLFILGSSQIWISEYENATINLMEAKHIFEELESILYQAKSEYSLGSCYYYLSDYEESLDCFFHSLKLYTNSDDLEGQADAYNGIGSVYYVTQNYEESIKTLEKSLDILTRVDADKIKAKVFNGLGDVHYLIKNYDLSEHYYHECIELGLKSNLKQSMIFSYEGLASIYIERDQLKDAHESIDSAITLADDIEFKIGLANSLFLKGKICLRENLVELGMKNLQRAIKLAEEIEAFNIQCNYHQLLSEYYENKQEFERSIHHYKIFHETNFKWEKKKNSLQLRSLQMKIHLEQVGRQNEIYKLKNKELKNRASHLIESNKRIKTLAQIGQEINSKLDIDELYQVIYDQINTLMDAPILYIGIHDREKQVVDFPFYMKENLRLSNISVPMNHTGKFTVWCIKNQKELVINDFQKESTDYITLSKEQKQEKLPHSVMIIPLTIKNKIIGVMGVHSFESSSYPNDKVNIMKAMAGYVAIALENAQNYKRINDLYGLIENKNSEIMGSINYAKRIQNAFLPSIKQFDEVFRSSFILYQPKNIVAGDFYWLQEVGNTIIFAVADCTGRGVPGAMVSIICHNALNKAVNQYGLTTPSKILDKTRMLVLQTFSTSTSDVRDGMDISICSWNHSTNILEWSGANNPLWIIPKGSDSIIELKPDKQPIGQFNNPHLFTNHSQHLSSGDRIYLFSDGYADQFGGDRDKKYMIVKFRSKLLDIQDQPIKTHQSLLVSEFETWKGETDQVDDVCIMGVEL